MLSLAVALMTAVPFATVPPPAPVAPLPSPQQLAWHELGMYAFVHFNMNTFTGKEWGEGDETGKRFAPSALDVRQWTSTFKDAGMRGVIITAKHHDGFCLWPSKFTEHSVKNSPWRGGNGDLLQELSDSCRTDGLLLGIYLSPWDRNHPEYGNSAVYNEFFRSQLREVCTQYGPLFEVWFDGACGEGPTGKRQVYDWPSFYAVVRETQPNALMFSDAGPDIRWVGNERGYGSETNWAPFKRDDFYPGIPDREAELGTGHADGDHWVPAECDVSIRPGWYWRQSENDRVKTLKELEDIWYASVGRGCNLLLNVPADSRGLIPDPDVVRLGSLRRLLDATFATDLFAGRQGTATNVRGNDPSFAVSKVTDADDSTYWCTDDRVIAASIEIPLSDPQPLNRLELREAIALGQRVKKFDVEASIHGVWTTIADGTTIGPRRILRFPTITADALRVNIRDAKACPTLSTVRAFCAPPEVTIESSEPAFTDSTTVTMRSDVASATIHYTIDGKDPSSESPRYEGPLVLRDSTRVRAIAVFDGRSSVTPAMAEVTRFDPATFRPGVQLFAAPRPGLRMRLFDVPIKSLDELAGKTAAAEAVVDQIALPRDRPKDEFALVFDGYLTVPNDGVYTFSLLSDDGSRLFVGDDLVCNADAASIWETREGRIPLRAGTHLFRVEYFEAKGEERLRVRWSGPGFRDVAIPAEVLGH